MSEPEFRLEGEIRSPGVIVQLRNYPGGTTTEYVKSRSGYFLSKQLSPEPHDTRVRPFGRPYRSSPAKAGRVALFPTDLPTWVRRPAGRVRALICIFDSDWFESKTGFKADWNGRHFADCLDIRDRWIDGFLTRLAEETIAPGLASNVLTDCVCQSIIIELARYFQQFDCAQRKEPPGRGLRALDLDRIKALIEEGDPASLTLTGLAEKCQVSAGHLTRIFKQQTGCTIHAYVEAVRLARAESLLSETDLSMKQIAYRLGFACPSNFSYAFRRRKGETPSQFRHRLDDESR